MNRALRPLAGLLVACLVAAPARADEGQWMPEQIANLDHEALRRAGLELTAEQLWDGKGGGLLRAAVNLRGCSASFISADGLIATNHHCAYDALQAQSTVDRDLLQGGFLARSRADEVIAPGKTIRVVEAITDVSERVLAAAAAAPDDRARFRAVAQATREIVKECDATGEGRRCEVASFFGGSHYRLFTYLELADIRLVYAPPSSIGEFGGEVDNWMWPRHTGDFALLRAYVRPDGTPGPHAEDNVPYRPSAWLKVSHEGVAPGDFVAVMGYPGNTTRYLSAAGLGRMIAEVWPRRIDLYGEWIAIMEAMGAKAPAIAIKVAASKKNLANRYKNAQGMLDGVKRMGLLDRRRAEEARLADLAREPAHADATATLADLAAVEGEADRRAGHTFVLSSASTGPTLLAAAVDVVRWSRERQRPEAERASGYLDRDAGKLWDRINRRARDFDADVDAELLAALLARAAELPADQTIAGLAPLVAGKRGGRELFAPATRRLFRGTRLTTESALRALFDGDPAEVARSRDPLLVLARALADDVEAMEAWSEAQGGRRQLLEPKFIDLLAAIRPGPLYPDANATLRLSTATIRGYSPRDGLEALPQTTLAGQLAKVTGDAPFTLPPRVLAVADGASSTYWSDPNLGDLALCFLSDADTTGGNSGSPVINGKGELVGLNFDRVWENVANDFGYVPEVARNVAADARYLLWVLEQQGAGALVDELLGPAPGRGK